MIVSSDVTLLNYIFLKIWGWDIVNKVTVDLVEPYNFYIVSEFKLSRSHSQDSHLHSKFLIFIDAQFHIANADLHIYNNKKWIIIT